MLASILKHFRYGIALLGIPVFLTIDSPFGDSLFNNHGQDVATFLVFCAFIFAYFRSRRRARNILIIGMVIGLAGEYILSILLGMYHYRFNNIPLWLAFAHGLIFALVFKLSKKLWVRSNKELLQKTLIFFAISYSFFWLVIANDWFGFLCTILFLTILFYAKKSRLFFLIMFAVVCFIEQIGTATGCWYWPLNVFGLENSPPSGNPPSGIAVFYFLFDAIVLWIYLNILHPNLKKRYHQFNRIIEK